MRARKLAFLAAFALAALLLVGLPSLGQGLDPAGEVADAECYGHHKQEGFRSMDLFPTVISEVPKGTEFPMELTIRNPWLHELHDVFGYVNLTGAPGLTLPGGEPPEEKSEEKSISGGRPDQYVSVTFPLTARANATEIFVRVEGQPGALAPPQVGGRGVDLRNDFDLMVASPDGTDVFVGPDPLVPGERPLDATPTWVEEIRIPQKNLTDAGPGDWTITVAYRGQQADAPFRLTTGVYYNLTGVLLIPGPAKLMPGEQHTFRFSILAKDAEGLQAVRYGGIAEAYHEHTDKNIGDVGNHDKWNTMQFKTGAQLVVAGARVGDAGDINLLEPVIRRWGQVLGFAASFLIIPSLVFGGTFGKGSVNVLNKWFGSPRRRVLFHNSMSFWLLGVSLLHMVIYFYEAFWNWSHGLVWGGLSLASMIGLGITGATQRSFVAKWGFTRWRFVHFGMGVLLVVFILIHMTADGSHLAPIREYFGPDPAKGR